MIPALEKILAPISRQLGQVDRELESVLTPEGTFIARPGAHILSSSGKKIRPALLLLASRLNGRKACGSGVKLAAALELIHTASLLHDDVLDRAVYRRGEKSVNQRWGNKTAILLGDFFYSRAVSLVIASCPRSNAQLKLLKALADASSAMCRGEIEQLSAQMRKRISTEQYVSIITNKTAALMSAGAYVGGILASMSDPHLRALRVFGMNFGIAFQMTDDILDYLQDSHEDGNLIAKVVKNRKAADDASRILKRFSVRAEKQLSAFRNCPARDSLFDLSRYVATRHSLRDRYPAASL